MSEIVEIGKCLKNTFNQEVGKVFKIEKPSWSQGTYYKIRYLSTGKADSVPDDYIPYSYEVVPCPDIAFPPRPDIKVGQCVEWSYRHEGKAKTDQGIVQKIHNDEATIELQRERFGVKGQTWQDIYELSPCSKTEQPPKLPQQHIEPRLSISDCEDRYLASELKDIARKTGISPTMSKRDLCSKLIKIGAI